MIFLNFDEIVLQRLHAKKEIKFVMVGRPLHLQENYVTSLSINDVMSLLSVGLE